MRWCNTCNKEENYCCCRLEGNVPDFGDEEMTDEQIECECGCLEFYLGKQSNETEVIFTAECISCGKEVTLISINIG